MIVVIPLAVVVPVIVEDVLILVILAAVRGAAAVCVGVRIVVRCVSLILLVLFVCAAVQQLVVIGIVRWCRLTRRRRNTDMGQGRNEDAEQLFGEICAKDGKQDFLPP